MFLNISAAWKDLASALEDDGSSEGAIEDCRRGFYCGASALRRVQTNIVEQHEEKHAHNLLEALDNEIETFFDELRALV